MCRSHSPPSTRITALSPSHAVDSIIASERNGVEVRVRVILHTVGNFVDTSIKNYVEHYVMATYGQI